MIDAGIIDKSDRCDPKSRPRTLSRLAKLHVVRCITRYRVK